MQTLHGHSKKSERSGLGPVTFLQTKHTHLHLDTCRVVDIKTSKPGLLRKPSHHWTDIIPRLTKVNISPGFCTIYVHSMGIIPSLQQACCLLLANAFSSVSVTNQIFIMKHRPVAPELRVSRTSVDMCTLE